MRREWFAVSVIAFATGVLLTLAAVALCRAKSALPPGEWAAYETGGTKQYRQLHVP